MAWRTGVALAALAAALVHGGAAQGTEPPSYDVLIRNGIIYDGSGAEPYRGEVAISADRIVAVGASIPGSAKRLVDAKGLAVTPGFINMLSWATESLLVDGLGQSDLRQGVTLEVMGDGWSRGPLNDRMKTEAVKQQGDFKYPIEWTTLVDYLSLIERRGTAMNVASFMWTNCMSPPARRTRVFRRRAW